MFCPKTQRYSEKEITRGFLNETRIQADNLIYIPIILRHIKKVLEQNFNNLNKSIKPTIEQIKIIIEINNGLEEIKMTMEFSRRALIKNLMKISDIGTILYGVSPRSR